MAGKKGNAKEALGSVFQGPPILTPPKVDPPQVPEQAQPEEQPVKEPKKAPVKRVKAPSKPKPKKPAAKASVAPKTKKAEKEPKAVVGPPTEADDKGRRMPFTFQLPIALHQRIVHYIENYAVGRGNSISKVLIQGAEELLDGLEKKAGIKR